MTDPAPSAPPGREALPARVFRALFRDFDLHTPDGMHVAVLPGHPLVRRAQPGCPGPPDQLRASTLPGQRRPPPGEGAP